jgi:hypothetical protein
VERIFKQACPGVRKAKWLNVFLTVIELGESKTDQAKRFASVPGAISECMSDVVGPSHSQQADCQVAQTGHYLGSGFLPNPGSVLIKRDVANPVDFVFNRPLASV